MNWWDELVASLVQYNSNLNSQKQKAIFHEDDIPVGLKQLIIVASKGHIM